MTITDFHVETLYSLLVEVLDETNPVINPQIVKDSIDQMGHEKRSNQEKFDALVGALIDARIHGAY